MGNFERYIGIDYSGAQTSTSSLKGLRVYLAKGGEPPTEVSPPPSPRKYWTRTRAASRPQVSAAASQTFKPGKPRPGRQVSLECYVPYMPPNAANSVPTIVELV